jgi:hypothetical protein
VLVSGCCPSASGPYSFNLDPSMAVAAGAGEAGVTPVRLFFAVHLARHALACACEQLVDHLPKMGLGSTGAGMTNGSRRPRWRQSNKGEIKSPAAFVALGPPDLFRQSGNPAIEIDLGDGGKKRLSLSCADSEPVDELVARKARFPQGLIIKGALVGISGPYLSALSCQGGAP